MYELTQTQLKDLEYFRENVKDFLNDNALRFKHVLISNAKIVRSFDGVDKAVEYAADNFDKGEYIIQQVVDENEIVNFI